jgi:hypothetical protein
MRPALWFGFLIENAGLGVYRLPWPKNEADASAGSSLFPGTWIEPGVAASADGAVNSAAVSSMAATNMAHTRH